MQPPTTVYPVSICSVGRSRQSLHYFSARPTCSASWVISHYSCNEATNWRPFTKPGRGNGEKERDKTHEKQVRTSQLQEEAITNTKSFLDCSHLHSQSLIHSFTRMHTYTHTFFDQFTMKTAPFTLHITSAYYT